MQIVSNKDIADIRDAVKADLCKALKIVDPKKQKDLKLAWNNLLSRDLPGFNVYIKNGKDWDTYRHNRDERGAFCSDTRDVLVSMDVELRDAVQMEAVYS